MTLECVHAPGPELAKGRQPDVQLLKGFRLQTVDTALSVHRGLDEPGVAQHAQVLRHRRLRHAKLTLDLANRLLGREEEGQDRAAVRLRKNLEDGFHASRYTPHGIYVS